MSIDPTNPQTIGEAIRVVRGLLADGEKAREVPRSKITAVLDLPSCAAFKVDLTARVRLMVAAVEVRIAANAAAVELKPKPKAPLRTPVLSHMAALHITREVDD